MPIKDLSGQRFGRLLVLLFAGQTQHGQALWTCRCDCGKDKVVRSTKLVEGRTTSCGCFALELTIAKGRRNLRHGLAKSPTYSSWVAMKQRCTNPNYGRARKTWEHYGGRGVRVCERWMSFENFLADMGERPTGTTLGRFRDEGNYQPGNVKWMTWAEQRANRREQTGSKATS